MVFSQIYYGFGRTRSLLPFVLIVRSGDKRVSVVVTEK